MSASYSTALRWDSPGGVQTQATNTYGIDTFGTDYVKLDYGLDQVGTARLPITSPTKFAISTAAN